MVTADTKPLGICPACGETVRDADDPVWICPCDLSRENAYWQPSSVTEADMERDGVYSLCWENHPGGWCSDHMPLHGRCYDGAANW